MPVNPNPHGSPNDSRYLVAVIGFACGAIGGWVEIARLIWGASIHNCLSALWQGDIIPADNPLPLVGGAGLGLLAGGLLFWLMTRPEVIHHRGRELVSPQKMRRKLRPRRGQIPSIPFPGGVVLTIEQECRHVLVAGSPGGGKTVALIPMIGAAIEREDLALIFSFKSDFQEIIDAPILAPWDRRSVRWLMGEDVATRADAVALAETLIPTQDKDPIWSQGAQSLLVGVLLALQAEVPGMWTATELAQRLVAVCGDFSLLQKTMEEQNPAGLMYLKGGESSRTTASFLSSLAAGIEPIIDLGVAQQGATGEPWSVRRWLAGEVEPVGIIGFSTQHERLAKRFAASIVEQATRQVLDLPDCRPADRRVWFFLDEVPQMGKIPSITQALVTGRSKGMRVVLGLQSIAQVRQLYSREEAEVWESSTATKILVQINGAEDQRWASKLVGDREVSRFQRTISGQGGLSKNSRSDQYQRREEPVLMPSEFSARLGPDSKGVRVLLLHDDLASIVRAPFQGYQKHRAGVEPAEWTRPSFRREGWGKVPPVVAAPPVVPQATEHQGVKPKDVQAPAETVIQDFPQAQSETLFGLAHVALDVADTALGLPPLVSGLAERMVALGHGHDGVAPTAVVSSQGVQQRKEREAVEESEIG